MTDIQVIFPSHVRFFFFNQGQIKIAVKMTLKKEVL